MILTRHTRRETPSAVPVRSRASGALYRSPYAPTAALSETPCTVFGLRLCVYALRPFTHVHDLHYPLTRLGIVGWYA